MRAPLLLVVVLLCASRPTGAEASVQRCVAADGTTIYTDRSCGAFDARPAARDAARESTDPATMTVDGAVGGFSIRGCARSPDALLRGVRDALLARDVNRLANFYHWSGTGSSAATALMNRLEHIADGPSGAVDLVYADAVPDFARPPRVDGPSPPPPTAPRSPWWPMSAVTPATGGTDRAEPADAAVASPTEPVRPPVGLRVEVGRDDGTGGFEGATFALRQNAGCWFIQF